MKDRTSIFGFLSNLFFAIVFFLYQGIPSFPPNDAIHWVFYLAIILTPLSFFSGSVRGRLSRAINALVFLISYYLLIQPIIEYANKVILTLLFLLGFLVLENWQRLIKDLRSADRAFILLVFALCISIINFVSGSLLLGMMALFYFLILTFLMTIFLKSLDDIQYPSALLIPIYFLLSGHYYAEIPLISISGILLSLPLIYLIFIKSYAKNVKIRIFMFLVLGTILVVSLSYAAIINM